MSYLEAELKGRVIFHLDQAADRMGVKENDQE
jgi:hypothetical protein